MPSPQHPSLLSPVAIGHRLSPLIAACLLAVAVTGCGKDNGTVPVTGTARVAGGDPLPAGRIMLYGGDTGPSGQIQPDGSFRLGTFTTTDGARPGRYKVVITGVAPPDTRPYEEAMLHPELAPQSLIHQKYNRAETSDLEVSIAEGPNELAFELDPNPRLKKGSAAKSR